MSVLSSETIETFQRDGVVLLEGVFDDWIDTLRAGVDTNMSDPGLSAAIISTMVRPAGFSEITVTGIASPNIMTSCSAHRHRPSQPI